MRLSLYHWYYRCILDIFGKVIESTGIYITQVRDIILVYTELDKPNELI